MSKSHHDSHRGNRGPNQRSNASSGGHQRAQLVNPMDDSKNLEVIHEYVFDLCDAITYVKRTEDVTQLYEQKHAELTNRFFTNFPWPDSSIIAGDCNNDEFFICLYKEMATRHVTTNNNISSSRRHQIDAWENYKKFFNLVIAAPENAYCFTPQWVYDITQEFAYQFQGFCQMRCQVTNQGTEVIKLLEDNRDAWNLPEVMTLLSGMVKRGKDSAKGSMHQLFGYFAAIELSRVECLVGDFSASIAGVAHLRLNDRNELFMQLPISHFNVQYHVAVSLMMLKRFDEALDLFAELILFVLRALKPGAASTFRPNVPQQLQRMVDKAMSLAAILLVICPAHRIEDQVKDAIEQKFNEKMKKLAAGERSAAVELFESSCPKFIAPQVPDYSVSINLDQAAFQHKSNVLVSEVMEYIPFLKLRTFLKLYSAIDISKLSRFTNIDETELTCLLLSYKNKAALTRVSSTSEAALAANVKDIHFYFEGGLLRIDNFTKKYSEQLVAQEKLFVASSRKNLQTVAQLENTFSKFGL